MAQKQGATFYGSVEEYVSARSGNRAIKKVSLVCALYVYVAILLCYIYCILPYVRLAVM